MATIGNTLPTMLDVAKRVDNNGNIIPYVNTLLTHNEILEDMVVVEANNGTNHVTPVVTGLPDATWRKLNYGVAQTKGTVKKVSDAAGLLEAESAIDEELAELNGNSASWRAQEDSLHLQGMTRDMATTLFYGDTTVNPERFMGFDPRFNTPSTDEDLAGYNMIDGGAADGQTDTTSIWVVGWSPMTVCGFYPKGTAAGFSSEDKGKERLYDSANNAFYGYVTKYKWRMGLSVRNWRYVSRIVNIDYSSLKAGSVDLRDLLIDATERIPSMSGVRCAIYMHRLVRAELRKNYLSKAGSNLTFDTVAGKRVMMFGEIPVRRCDQLTLTETAIPDATGTFA